MANAFRVRTTVESDTLVLPELLPFVGKRVEVIVVEDDEPPGSLGSPVCLANDHREAAGLVATPQRVFGSLRGRLRVPDELDDPLPDEVVRAFEGEGDE